MTVAVACNNAFMEFQFQRFTCDVEAYWQGENLVVRFFDRSLDPQQIVDLVRVPPSFGFLYLSFVGDDGFLGGFLDESVFTSEAMVDAAISFTEGLSPRSRDAYIPHHVAMVRLGSSVEYDGET